MVGPQGSGILQSIALALKYLIVMIPLTKLMAAQYKHAAHERGFSPYTTSKSEQSQSQKHLSQWTDEEWQTSDGKAEARETVDGEDGEKVERMRRYLPKRAWEEMSDEEKREAERTKEEGGEDGSQVRCVSSSYVMTPEINLTQYVPNTSKAKEARKEVGRKVEEGDTSEADDEEGEEGEGTTKPSKRRREDSTEGESNSDTEYEDDDSTEEGGGYYEEEERQPAAKKAKTESGGGRVTRSTRGRDKAHDKHQTHDQDEKQDGDNDQPTSEDETTEENEHGQPCSASRLPKEGQTVHWRSTSWIEGNLYVQRFFTITHLEYVIIRHCR